MTNHQLTCYLAATFVVAACGPGSDSMTAETATDAAMGRTPLQGAWQTVELQLGDGATIANPASLWLFESSHYSIMYSRTAERTTFANADSATDAETMEAYASFIANAGTYSLSGDTIVIRPVIAKHPNYMGGGQDMFSWRVAGDTLWLTSVPGGFRWASGQGTTNTAMESHRLVRVR